MQLLLTELQILVLKTFNSTKYLKLQVVSPKCSHLLGSNLGSCANAANTETGQHQTNYNVVIGGNPKCKQVQRLVTVLSAFWIVVIWLVVCVNPHVSADEPSEDEKLYHKLYWEYTSFLSLASSLVLCATRKAVGDKATRSSHNQINRDQWFHWALVVIFSSYKDTIQCAINQKTQLLNDLARFVTQYQA